MPKKSNIGNYLIEVDKQLYYLSHYDVGDYDYRYTIDILKMYLNVLTYVVVKEGEFEIDSKIRSIYSLLNSDDLDTVEEGIAELEKQMTKWSDQF